MAEFETIRSETKDGITVITLARPDKRNAISLQMFRELGDAAEAAGSDPSVRGVLVAADGPSFCAGIDLSLLGELSGLATAAADRPEEFVSFVRMAQRPFAALARMPKPTVAAVHGHAVGAGFQLALACDLRVAASDARFAMLEARYGLIPDLGGLFHLTRLIGPARAKELAWSTRIVEAEEAARIGLVNKVVAPETLADETRTMIRDATAHSLEAAGPAKDLVGRAFETSMDEELEREATAQSELARRIGPIL